MEHIDEEIARLLLDLGIDKANLNWTTRVTMILAILLVSYIVTKLFRHALIPAVRKAEDNGEDQSHVGRLLVQR